MQLSKSKIVCAANKFFAREQTFIVVAPRHYDQTMHKTMELIGVTYKDEVEQGFVDQHGIFFNRTEAYYIAVAQNQVEPQKDKRELFSEDLY